ncbi:MAG: DUF4232 domain-containing protein [Betaproteobacteria bacterium]
MNDEQLEHQVRQAVRQFANRPAPESLRRRVGAIPAMRPTPARPAAWIGRVRWLMAAAASLTTVIVATAIVVVTLSRGSAVPTATGSPSAVPSGAPASPTPGSAAPQSATPATRALGWTLVMRTGSGASLLQDGDTVAGALSFSGGYLLAGNAGNGQNAVIWQSPDGVTWHRIESAPDFASSQLRALVPVPDGVLALGTSSSLDPLCPGGEGTTCNPVNPIRLWISSDGSSWQRLPDSATAVFGRAQLGPVAAGPGGVVLFGWHMPVDSNLAAEPVEWTSHDGRTWQEQSQFATAFPLGVVEGLVAGRDGFSAVGRNTGLGSPHAPGTAWFSPDGRTWTAARVPSSTDDQTSVLAGDAGMLAAGSIGSGRVLWASPDGRSWTSVDPASVPFAASDTGPLLVSDGAEIIAIGAERAGAAGVWATSNATSWTAVASSGPVPPIPTAAGSTIGALGPLGVVMAATANTAGGMSTSVWVGAISSDLRTSPAPTESPMSASTAVPACASTQLAITAVDSGGGLGTVGGWLRFLNASDATCSLHGWPSLIGVTASGTTTVATQNQSGLLTFPAITGVPTVTLNPGEAAFAAYAGGDNPVGSATTCPPAYHTLQVTPPGATQAVSVSAWNYWLNAYTPACVGLEVTMVIPASTVPELEPLRP